MTEADVLRALRDCYDPLLKRSVVELGLVASLSVLPDPDAPGAAVRSVPPRFRVLLSMRSPSADESRTAQLRGIVENRLAGLAALSRVEIEMLPAIFPILRPQ
jgi:hypothetical protein